MLKYLSVQVNLEVSNVGGDAGRDLEDGVDDTSHDTEWDSCEDEDEIESDFDKDAGMVLWNNKHNGGYDKDGVRNEVTLPQSPWIRQRHRSGH